MGHRAVEAARTVVATPPEGAAARSGAWPAPRPPVTDCATTVALARGRLVEGPLRRPRRYPPGCAGRARRRPFGARRRVRGVRRP
jgi:hypothetical protein